jgi:hypothetical protein
MGCVFMGWDMDIDYSGLTFPASKRGNSDSVKFIEDYDNICPLDATELSIN